MYGGKGSITRISDIEESMLIHALAKEYDTAVRALTKEYDTLVHALT